VEQRGGAVELWGPCGHLHGWTLRHPATLRQLVERACRHCRDAHYYDAETGEAVTDDRAAWAGLIDVVEPASVAEGN
jgi:hypothetical protein